MGNAEFRVAATVSSDFPVRVDVMRTVLRDLAEVSAEEMPFRPLTPEEEAELAKRLKPYHGLLVRSGIFSENLLSQLPSLRVIGVHGAGFDQIDVAAAERLGIYVANAPGANAPSVAELAVALMIDLLRKVTWSATRVRTLKEWGAARHLGGELNGRTLGLVGYGRIGRRVAAAAKAFGMEVLVHDPFVGTAGVTAEGAELQGDLDQVLRRAHIVSLHLPLTEQTRHLINRDRIQKMRRGAYLVNTARGELVDEEALYEALSSGHLAGAALDVMEQEPPHPGNKLLQLDNVIITPHLGGSTEEALERIAYVASAQIRQVLEGGEPEFGVNRPSRPRR